MAELPREAVGILGGEGAHEASRYVALPSLGGEREFLADPHAQYRAELSLSRDRLRLIAVVHSHPDGKARLSHDDVGNGRLGNSRACVQVVASIDSKRRVVTDCAAFVVGQAGVTPIALSVAGRSPRRAGSG
jgi:proteasome lid subunit RPN8/RPN11